MYGQPCSSVLTLDLSSVISFRNVEWIGYKSHRMQVELLAMLNSDPHSKQGLTIWPICWSMSTRVELVWLYLLTAIASWLHPLSGCIPSGKCYSACCPIVSPTRIWTHCIKVVARGLITASHGMWARTNPHMRWPFQVCWLYSAFWKSIAASLDHFVCQFR